MKRSLKFLLLILAVLLISRLASIILPSTDSDPAVDNQTLSKNLGTSRQETAPTIKEQIALPPETENIQALEELTKLIKAGLEAKALAKTKTVLPIPDDQPIIEEEQKQLAQFRQNAKASPKKTDKKVEPTELWELDFDQHLVLQKLDQEYGIPAEVMVSLWHLESLQGNLLGKYRTTATLSQSELKYFKQICRETNRKINQPCSKKGALGHFQFMPSTWVNYAQDFNGDGKADPFCFADSAATAAKYLAANNFSQDPKGALAAYLGGNLNSKSARSYVAKILTRAKLYAPHFETGAG